MIYKILAAALVLAGQPLLLLTTDWGIAYVNAHPVIKPYGIILGVVASIIFAFVANKGWGDKKNFLVFLGCALAATLIINMLFIE